MLKKIISGGQTGADRAALDVALKFNIPHGGWLPKGRRTENGPLSPRYKLTELPGKDYRDRTRKNVQDSHGTIIISRGPLTGGSLLTQSYAEAEAKPCYHLDLMINDTFEASLVIQSFIMENRIQVLNIAGPRASNDPGIYFDVKTILESLVYLLFLDRETDEMIDLALPNLVRSVASPEIMEEAVSLIIEDMTFKSKAFIARLDDSKIVDIYFSWLDYLRIALGFDSGNDALLKSCRQNLDVDFFSVEDGVMEIVKMLKKELERHYRLRIVK